MSWLGLQCGSEHFTKFRFYHFQEFCKISASLSFIKLIFLTFGLKTLTHLHSEQPNLSAIGLNTYALISPFMFWLNIAEAWIGNGLAISASMFMKLSVLKIRRGNKDDLGIIIQISP
ncbi:MAG: hypothetical protein AB2708_06405 [Candidatus Thiodiazotropha taylori]